ISRVGLLERRLDLSDLPLVQLDEGPNRLSRYIRSGAIHRRGELLEPPFGLAVNPNCQYLRHLRIVLYTLTYSKPPAAEGESEKSLIQRAGEQGPRATTERGLNTGYPCPRADAPPSSLRGSPPPRARRSRSCARPSRPASPPGAPALRSSSAARRTSRP